MTALFMDGFDHYGVGAASSTQMLDGPYGQILGRECGAPPWGPARTGLSCLIGNNVFNTTAQRVLPTTQTDLYASFGWACDSLSSSNAAIFSFYDSSGTVHAHLTPTATGALNVVTANGTVIAGTSGPAVVTQNWHFFELHLDTSTGTFVLRLDDANASNPPLLNFTDSRLQDFSMGIVGLLVALGNGGPTVYMDDLFVRNGSGSSNNSFLGDRRVSTLFANGDTATAGWTPSYYKLFGQGIYRGPYTLASNTTVQNQGAYVAATHSTSLDIGAADFTLETFIRWDQLPASGAYSSIFSRWNTSQNQESYRLILGGSSFNGGCLQFDTSTDGTPGTQQTMVQYPWTPQTNTWYHLAIVRAAGELLLFVNGVQLGLPITDSRTYFSGGTEFFALGQEFTLTFQDPIANTFMAARLDETRFTNGVGRYTATFTPPTAAFPRGSGDPFWSDVVLLMGYDGTFLDESSFAQAMSNAGGALAFIPTDGPLVGAYSTVNKTTPDDNTFISASLTNATNVLTMNTQPAVNDTVTVGTTNGTTPAVYTFKSSVGAAFTILIDTSAEATLTNLMNAINAGTGSGTKYGTGTTSNFDVNASLLPVGQIEVMANLAGATGNSIASTATGSHAVWITSALTGGANIPGPTNFTLQRPPNNTTIISAIQPTVRALKTDAGTATFNTTFIGALGGTATSSTFNLTTSPSYYSEIVETDPDTSGPITPTTIVNGKVQVNRLS